MDAETKMALYYLNAMGQGLAGEDHPMQQVGAVTKQQIETQKYEQYVTKQQKKTEDTVHYIRRNYLSSKLYREYSVGMNELVEALFHLL